MFLGNKSRFGHLYGLLLLETRASAESSRKTFAIQTKISSAVGSSARTVLLLQKGDSKYKMYLRNHRFILLKYMDFSSQLHI